MWRTEAFFSLQCPDLINAIIYWFQRSESYWFGSALRVPISAFPWFICYYWFMVLKFALSFWIWKETGRFLRSFLAFLFWDFWLGYSPGDITYPSTLAISTHVCRIITTCRLKQFLPCHVQKTFMHVQCQEKFVANQLLGSFTWFTCECFINFAWLQMLNVLMKSRFNYWKWRKQLLRMCTKKQNIC
jgi:hypothetical protein